MRLPSLAGIATIVLLLECSNATNLRKSERTHEFETPRDLSVSCGGGVIGNKICADRTLCCSKWGHCGSSIEYCDGVIPPENPCGGGEVGNNVCADSNLCCSKYGYCGTSSEHCDNSPVEPLEPTDAPIITTLPPFDGPVGVGGDSRLIAYLGNWKSCPTDAQLDQYTHIMIAFAVSYDWNPAKNVCDTECKIKTPPVCASANPSSYHIKKWKEAGKKIILSFGGAGMGGSWPPYKDDCWEYCFGRETQVADRLTDIVIDMGLDGVDIDYEYFYENGQKGSGFTNGAAAQIFLKDLTLELRQKLPEGAELTHAPMDSDMVQGSRYYEILKEVAHTLDFLMPQYYNGIVNPSTDFNGAVQHFTNLKDDMFGGDASKISFGFCIKGCSRWNLDGLKSASVMKQLSQSFPCNGGAMFWHVSDDVNGDWSTPVRNQIKIDSGQCSVSEPSPTFPPTASPTKSPTTSPTKSPTKSPTTSPIASPIASPTKSPTKSPTTSPTKSPTTSPIVSPTKSPTASPIASPTKSPTTSPIAPPVPSPVPLPTPDSGDGCCSNDYKTCATWCQDSRDQCGSSTCVNMKWLDNGALGNDATCAPRWGACTDTGTAGCCDGLVCKGNSPYWKQCLPPPN